MDEAWHVGMGLQVDGRCRVQAVLPPPRLPAPQLCGSPPLLRFLSQVVNLTDSDDEDAVLSPPKPTIGQQVAVAEAAQVAAIIARVDKAAPAAGGQGHPEAAPAGNRDVQQPATQPQTQPAASPATQPASEKKAPPRSAAKPRGTPRGGRGAGAAANDSQPGASSQAAGGPSSQAAGPPSQAPPASQGGGGTAQKRAAVGLHAPSNQMTVVLPDKLPQLKMLVELESNPGGGADSQPRVPVVLPSHCSPN